MIAVIAGVIVIFIAGWFVALRSRPRRGAPDASTGGHHDGVKKRGADEGEGGE